MSALTIEAAIWSGLRETAACIGFPYQQFRPAGPGSPVAGTPLNPALPVAASVTFNKFDAAPSWEKPQRFLYVDGTQTAVGDYLVGGPLGTLAIVSQDPMLPIMGIVCNHVLTFKRPAASTTLGAQPGYGGDVAGQETALLTGWPAYLGVAGGGGRSPAKLPGDVEMPHVDIRLPMWPAVVLLNGDVIFDEQGRRYKIISAEGTTLGWKIAAVLSMT